MKVLIADDHKIVRQGLVLLLKSDPKIEKVFEASGGKDAVKMAAELKPDVCIMDLHMPDMNGADATREILAKNPKIRVIALTTDSDKRFIKEVFKAGASGYLLKDCAVDELVHAIHSVMSGRTYLSSTVSNLIIEGYASDSTANKQAVSTPLTARETEVLKLIAEGLSSKEIAAKLNMSVRTVETHRHAISEKLNLRSIAELTKYALKMGLISH
jgi:two-component system, NarL family, response regulator NreC